MNTLRARISLACLTMTAGLAPAFAVQTAPAQQDHVEPVAMPLPPKAMCYWKRDSFLPGATPDDLPEQAMQALEHWWEFAFEHDYRIDIERDGRVLMISDYRDRRTRKKMILAEDTLDQFDLHLPIDPLDADETLSTARLAIPVHDDQPIVLLRMRNQSDLAYSRKHAAELVPRLKSWANHAPAGFSYWLPEPSVAAWVVDPDVEEWSEANEMVNHMSQCLLEDRFGRQPHWFTQGVAWFMELEVLDSIYCFPHRNGFVGSGEHAGWESELRRSFRSRKSHPLTVEELASWKRGTYDETSAGLAWGLVSFLAHDWRDQDDLEEEEENHILADIALEMGAHRHTFGVRTFPDGRWEVLPDYELDAEIQRQILQHHAGDHLFEEATRAFRLGSRYKPSSTR